MHIGAAYSLDKGNKIAFANVLRGIAAVTVVMAHYLYGFWTVPAAIAGMIGAPAIEAQPNAFTKLIDVLFPYGFLGHFGVALFFLISGFVIPFALTNRGRTQFLIERFFRLWPTYAVGLTLTVLAIVACSRWYGNPLPFEPSTYVLQLLFVRDLFWVPSIDGIIWTLEIEIKFYLIAMVLAGALRAGRLFPVLAVAIGITGLFLVISLLPGWMTSGSWYFRPLYALSHSGMVICFMFIGTVFNFLYRDAISLGSALFAGALLFSAMAVQWPVGVMAGATWSGIFSYAAALVIFAASYCFRDLFRDKPGVFAALAAVSYPLYVVHGVAGYVVIRLVLDAGVSPIGAISIAAILAGITAWIIHLVIETPSHEVGKRIGRKIGVLLSARREAVS